MTRSDVIKAYDALVRAFGNYLDGLGDNNAYERAQLAQLVGHEPRLRELRDDFVRATEGDADAGDDTE